MRLSVASLLLLSCLILPNVMRAQSSQATAAGFPITVHVVYSRSANLNQQLDTEIGGQQVQLWGASGGVLAPGDYPARISSSVRAPSRDRTAYDIYRGYDLLMPDGKTRTYTVIGLGPAVSQP